MRYFIIKFPSKWELPQTGFKYSPDIGFQDFTNHYKTYTEKSYSILVIDATLASDNPIRFRKNPLEII